MAPIKVQSTTCLFFALTYAEEVMSNSNIPPNDEVTGYHHTLALPKKFDDTEGFDQPF